MDAQTARQNALKTKESESLEIFKLIEEASLKGKIYLEIPYYSEAAIEIVRSKGFYVKRDFHESGQYYTGWAISW